MSHLFRALSAARTHSLRAVIGSFDYLWLVWLTKITTGLIPPKFVSRELQHFLILLQLDTPSSYNSSNGRMSRYSARQGLHYSRTFWAILSLPSSLQDANRDASSLAGQLTCRCSRRDDIPPQRFRCTRLSQFVLCLYRWKNACKGRQFGVLPRNWPKRSTVPPMSSSSRKLEVTASAVMQACKCSLRCFQVCWQYIESFCNDDVNLVWKLSVCHPSEYEQTEIVDLPARTGGLCLRIMDIRFKYLMRSVWVSLVIDQSWSVAA